MPRYPKGMFRRKKAFYARLYENGRERWIGLGGDYQEARTRLQELRSKGVPQHPLLTISEASGRWLNSYVRTARNERGQKLTKARVEQFLSRYMGRMKVDSVTREDLRAYRVWLEKQGIKKPLSPQSVAHILSDARCFFNWCEDSGLIDRSPVPRKLLPRIQERPPDRLTNEEVERLIALREPYGFVLRLAFGTGLRWSELCRVQASDVENGVLIVSQTKSGKVRRVPLSDDLLADLRLRVGRLVPFKRSWSFTLIARRESEVPRFHPHQTRHTFACQWLEKGGSLAALQRILGHSTISTTERYARLTDAFVRDEARRIYAAMA